MRSECGVTLVELVTVLAILAAGVGVGAPAVGSVFPVLRVRSAAAELHGAIHLTRARARAAGRTHALVIEPGGRAFRIVEDPGGADRTVAGPTPLAGGALASSNVTLRFSPKGFAVPFGTITVESEGEVRRLVVNLVGRVRMATGPS